MEEGELSLEERGKDFLVGGIAGWGAEPYWSGINQLVKAPSDNMLREDSYLFKMNLLAESKRYWAIVVESCLTAWKNKSIRQLPLRRLESHSFAIALSNNGWNKRQ